MMKLQLGIIAVLDYITAQYDVCESRELCAEQDGLIQCSYNLDREYLYCKYRQADEIINGSNPRHLKHSKI